MMSARVVRVLTLAVVALAGSATFAAAQGIGLKVGPTFAKFNADNLDFDTRTGVAAGVFFGGNRDGIVGVQAEVNWVRKNTEGSTGDIRVDYIQVPVLLRLNAGTNSANGFVLYGVGGPSVSYHIADEIQGSTLNDGFEGIDAGIVAGVGVEITRFIIEARYEWGLRHINKDFQDLSEITSRTAFVLFGVRFR